MIRTVFLGTGEIGLPALQMLAGWPATELLALYCQPDRPAGREMKLRPPRIKEEAVRLGLPVFQPAKIRAPEVLDALRALAPDLVVVVAYGQILPRALLEIPRLGCLNVHASLLPRHRGASPINAAILAGDAVSGITIMQMDEGLDTGAVLWRSSLTIGRHETAQSLHDRLAALAPAALQESLSALFAGQIQPESQNEALATYAPKLKREDGRVDWSLPAAEIDQRIRAFTPWPGAYFRVPFSGEPLLVKIHQAALCRRCHGQPGSILRADRRGILIAAGSGAILLREIQAAGARRLSVADFLHGRPLFAGMVLS